jgi:hypothetical protein
MLPGSELETGRNQRKRKRPIILTIVCILLFVRILLAGMILAVLLMGITYTGGEELLSQALGAGFILALTCLCLFILIAVIGLWKLRPWAWQLNMMIIGFLLVTGLWTHFAVSASNRVNDLTLLLNIIIVFYLVQTDVRELFITENRTIDHP